MCLMHSSHNPSKIFSRYRQSDSNICIKKAKELEEPQQLQKRSIKLEQPHQSILRFTTALAGGAWWIELWPVNQNFARSIPSQGMYLGCGPSF